MRLPTTSMCQFVEDLSFFASHAMSQVQPNSVKIYMAPINYLDMFVYFGRRYFLLPDKALVSDYGRYGMCPPADRGFYLLLPKKDYKKAKEGYELQKLNWSKVLNGYLNNGGERKQLSLF
jgi:hypothetical protein